MLLQFKYKELCMKKKLVVLSIISLMSFGGMVYAADADSKINIEQSNICIDAAKSFYENRDYANAEKKLNEALKLNNKNAEAYYRLGMIEDVVKNNKDKAISYFTKAIELDSHNVDYYRSRGNKEAEKLQFKQLFDDLNKIIELDPQNAEAYETLGIMHDANGHSEESIEYFNKAIQYSHNKRVLYGLYKERASAKINLRDYDGAIADYKNAIELAKQVNDFDKISDIEYLNQRIHSLKEAKKIFK